MATDKARRVRQGTARRPEQRPSLAGEAERIEAQHRRGKLTARERVAALLDPDSFEELDLLVTHRTTDFDMAERKVLGDAVVTGFGTIRGRPVYLFAQDFTVFGGSLGEVVGEKICKVMDLAVQNGAPLIGLNDSGGARIQEGVVSLAAYGEIFRRNTLLSGVVPQLSAILGPCAGGASYSPALNDFVFMVRGIGQMYITGPDVVRTVTGEELTHEELGGADAHATKSGTVHFVLDTEEECFETMRRVLGFLPQNNMEDPPLEEPTDDPKRADEDLSRIIPDEPIKAYDMREIIARIVDHREFLEIQPSFAQNILTGFARMNGRVVGIVAQQPQYLAGVLDIDASVKAARFVRFSDSFNIPILTFVDVPGFMPGRVQEHQGIIRHGAKLIYAYAEATVPKITIITRKAYGGAYLVMGSKMLRGDVTYAWPMAEVAVMGAEAAVNIVFRDRIARAEEPEEMRKKLIQEYEEQFNHPYVAASRGYIDDVIEPSETRWRIIRALEMLKNKRDTLPPKKHGNIPM